MSPEPSSLLIVSNSGRAIAESAARGGYAVTVLDAYCDDDTRAVGACATVRSDGSGLDPRGLRAAARGLSLPAGACGLVYGSGLERTPSVVSWLARSFPLLGNGSSVLDLLLDPRRLFGLLDRLGIGYPETRFDPPDPRDGTPWLVKETGRSGGLGVRPWRPAAARPRGPHYFQRRVDGPVMSVLFITDGEDLRVVGWNRLLSTAARSDLPFVYAGAIGRAGPGPSRQGRVLDHCRKLVQALGLRGVNNLDFVLDGDRVCVLELNPRPSATLGLYDADFPGGWVRHHVQACLGRLAPVSAARAGTVSGQRVVYAPQALRIPAALDWPDWAKDRPGGGARIPPGAPVCSVVAAAGSAAATEALLAERARRALRLTGCAPGSTL